MVAAQLKPSNATKNLYNPQARETVIVFAFLFFWVIESFASAHFLKGYRYAMNIQGQTFSFANPFQGESIPPYAYALWLVVLTAVYAYIAYASSPFNIGLGLALLVFPLRAWYEVPFEPIALYIFVSIWVVATCGLAMTLITWRMLRHFGRSASIRAANSTRS